MTDGQLMLLMSFINSEQIGQTFQRFNGLRVSLAFISTIGYLQIPLKCAQGPEGGAKVPTLETG